MDLLLSLDPARNRFRFFRVELVPGPEDAVELHRRWGRVGTDGRHTIERYASAEDARVARDILLARRRRRGYVAANADDLARARRLLGRHRSLRAMPAQLTFPVAIGF